MPTRIVTLTQQDVTRLEGLTYIALHRQPVLLPTRLADLVGQLGESSTAHRRPLGSGGAGAPKLFPGARPGAHQRAGYLGTSLNEQLGLQIRPGRGAALRPSRRTGRRSTGRTARAEERFHLRLGHSPVDVALRYLESFASTGGQA